MTTYLEAISRGFPAVQCHVVGDGSVYEDIVWDAGEPIPSKETLDTWIAANPEVASQSIITVLAFRNRFTQAEKIAIEFATLDNPSAPMANRQLAAAFRAMMKDVDAATFIDLARQDTIDGVTAFETYGVIGAGRANQILTAPIASIEIPVNV